jgi:hypothetical protein
MVPQLSLLGSGGMHPMPLTILMFVQTIPSWIKSIFTKVYTYLCVGGFDGNLEGPTLHDGSHDSSHDGTHDGSLAVTDPMMNPKMDPKTDPIMVPQVR